MADENNLDSAAEVTVPETPSVPAPKKQRAPRKQKTVAEAIPASSDATAKSTRAYRKKVGEPAVDATAVLGKATATGKSPKKPRGKTAKGNSPVISPAAKSAAPLTPVDEMAEIVQLEEENKRLRKAVAEKLRSENADLRKRLGVN
jgi:putative transposase